MASLFALQVRKRAIREGYTLTVDDAFEQVVAGCLRQHGASWLHPPLLAALAAMNAQDQGVSRGRSDGADQRVRRLDGNQGAACARLCVFALWRGQLLLAGEFGVVVGRAYTSFSGFYAANGAGAAQMVLTAHVLRRAGFAWWDMGQDHEYKRHLGASVEERAHFLDAFRRERTLPNCMGDLIAARSAGGRFDAAELLAT
jgi:Leu/Phe-tRNA-protein transferase